MAPASPAVDLGGRTGTEAEGMDPPRQLLGEDVCNHSMAIESRATLERWRDDLDSEMRLAAGTRAGVALMACGLIDDFQPRRRQSGRQLSLDGVNSAHGKRFQQKVQAAKGWRIGWGSSSRLACHSSRYHSMAMQFETMRGRGKREIPRQDVERRCDWPGCRETAEHRAPRSRRELNRFWWFCLGHVRQYNASWNYYAGMTEQEVEADVRFDTVWQRPSWRMGERIRTFAFGSANVRDSFSVFGHEGEARKRPSTPEEQALVVLDLEPPVTVAVVKARYKELVKRHHPDANGGAKAAEERFKDINAAYCIILKSLGE